MVKGKVTWGEPMWSYWAQVIMVPWLHRRQKKTVGICQGVATTFPHGMATFEKGIIVWFLAKEGNGQGAGPSCI